MCMVLLLQGYVGAKEERAVSKALRAAVDSRPLAGAGRVEDTINLLGHAARKIVQLVPKITEIAPEDVYRNAGLPLLLAPSIKAGLDIDWSDPKQKAMAIDVLERQISSLQRWVARHLDNVVSEPLRPFIETITQARVQALEVTKNGVAQIREGVAPERRFSIEDAEMRHGRKSKTKRFERPGLFSKHDFKIDLRAQSLTCPAGEVEQFEPGETVQFDPEACGACRLRSQCTQAASGKSRTVSIAIDKGRQKKFRKLQETRSGRAQLRKRTAIEQRSPTSLLEKEIALGTLV